LKFQREVADWPSARESYEAQRQAAEAQRQRLEQANEELRASLTELISRVGEPAAVAARSARKTVEVACEGCNTTIVGFGQVGTAKREAPKHGAKVLCLSCRTSRVIAE
jgi:hypothetical protein